MRRQHIVRRTGVALAAVLTLTLTGCGSGEGDAQSSTTNEPPSSLSDKTSAAEPEASKSPAPGKNDSTTPAAASGAITGEQLVAMMRDSMKNGGTAAVSMTSMQGESAVSMSGVVDYRSNPPAMSLTSKVAAMGGVESKIILVDNVMYMDMGEMSKGKYLKMPLGKETSQMLDLSQLDPVAAFKEVDGLQNVKERGKEKLKAGTFRRYDGEVSTAKMLEGLPESALADFPEVAKYSFWFDDDDHVRQVLVDLGKPGTTTMNYDDWGSKVSIKAPKASDITEMPATPQMPEAPTG